MVHHRRIVSLSFVCIVALAVVSVLRAAPPTLTGINPRGALRGKAIDLVITGTNLTPMTRLLLPFKATQRLLPDAKPNPGQVRIQLTVDPAVPLGIYSVRLLTDEGVSPFYLFSVDAFPNVNEVEDNNRFDKAQKVPFPVIVTGQCAGGDVDNFRFAVKKGQRVVVETEAARLGSGVVPQIRVTDARQRFVAADDSQKIRGDCRIIFTAPADGEYVVEVSDSRYRGGSPPDYRLKIGDYDVVEEVFPLGGRRGEPVTLTLYGGTLARPVQVERSLVGPRVGSRLPLALDGAIKAGMLSPLLAVGDLPERVRVKTGNKDPKVIDIAPPVTLNGRLGRKGQIDRYQFPVQPGQRFRLTVEAEPLGSYLDGVLRVGDQDGRQLALVDDVPVPAVTPGQPARVSIDPFTEVTVPTGVTMLVIDLFDQRHRGGINFGYRLTVEPAAADFQVHQPLAEVNVPRGGTAVLTVPVTRRGYNGAIQLAVPNLPTGITAAGGQVPEGAGDGVLTLTASPKAKLPEGVAWLRFEGRATAEGHSLTRRAEQRVVLNAAPDATPVVLTFHQFALALTGPDPINVQGPKAVELVKGYPATVPVAVGRATNHAALAVEVSGQVRAATAMQPQAAAAAGPFAVKSNTAAAGATRASFTLTASLAAPEGRVTDLVVQGKVRVNNVDRVIPGPAVEVTVLRPFVVEIAAKPLVLVSGQTVVLKGRLKRQAVFQEAVQILLTGLPTGVTMAAPPPTIPAKQGDFEIALRVDAKLASAPANLTLTCTTKIGGMTYTHPAVFLPVKVGPGK
jgi:hypothetical protein